MLRICPYKAGVGGSSPSTPTTLARARSTALLMARLLSRWVWVVRNRSGSVLDLIFHPYLVSRSSKWFECSTSTAPPSSVAQWKR